MSKKATKNQTKNQQPQFVDQETDPMLRALQKKVRNINKKLNEITQLATKKDLKPQQEEKVSKKAQVVQEREKYQEMISVYKEIAAENIKIIRKAQLSELEDLASIIAVREYGADLTANFNQSVDSLVKILTSTSRELTIQQRVAQITEALIKSANNEKLKTVVKNYIESNAQRKIGEENLSNEPEPISSRSEKEREAEIKELVEEERKEIEQKVVSQQPLTPQGLSASRRKENNTQTNTVVEVQKTGAQQAASEPSNEQNIQPSQTNNQDNNAVAPQDANNSNQQRKNQRNFKGEGRGRGGRGRGRGGRHYEDRGDKPYKKPTFKPKYEEKNPKQIGDDSDSSESSQPKARDFKREQVKDLINDGFIVVGKPKPKARDQKQFHDFEHGRKFHPHNQKKDY